jgi:hypothetical protein
MVKKIFLIIGVLLGIILIGLIAVKIRDFVDERRLTAAHIIELRKDGFFPQSVTIHQGEHITFVSKIGKPFWPASNIHPTHTRYSAFDPQKPVSAGVPWQFTFDRVGKWRFHDHIFPEFTGVITVLAPGATTLAPLRCDSGVENSMETKQQCWEEALEDALETNGIQGAFNVHSHLYKTDKDFVTTGCHAHAHRIGDAFYNEYASRRWTLVGLDLPVETVACGYGFFHGLFEHFFRKHPEVGLVREVCEDLHKRYGKTMPLIRVNCFHGAGHGLIPDPPEFSMWGKPLDMVSEPLNLCDRISPDAGEVEQCKEGIFNIITDWMSRNQYGLSLNTNDPFWLCRDLRPQDKQACYYELVMVTSALEGRDLGAITRKFIEPIPEEDIAQIVMESLAASFMQRDVTLSDQTPLLLACRNISQALHSACLRGIVSGFRSHGEPGKEYEKIIVFCSSPLMTQTEKDLCFKHMIVNLWYIYPEDKVKKICETLDKIYQSSCDKNPVSDWYK